MIIWVSIISCTFLNIIEISSEFSIFKLPNFVLNSVKTSFIFNLLISFSKISWFLTVLSNFSTNGITDSFKVLSLNSTIWVFNSSNFLILFSLSLIASLTTSILLSKLDFTLRQLLTPLIAVFIREQAELPILNAFLILDVFCCLSIACLLFSSAANLSFCCLLL